MTSGNAPNQPSAMRPGWQTLAYTAVLELRPGWTADVAAGVTSQLADALDRERPMDGWAWAAAWLDHHCPRPAVPSATDPEGTGRHD